MISAENHKSTILAAILAFALAAALCSVAPAVAHASEGELAVGGAALQTQGNIASGKWGTCKWAINAKGVLTVKPGKGAEQKEFVDTYGYKYYKSPWLEYSSKVTKVVFKAKGESKVIAPKNCTNLLSGMTKVTSADLSGLDASKVTKMDRMFANCPSLKALDLSSFDASSAKSMHSMFANCSSLKSLDLSSLKTSKVTDMSAMFEWCSSLKSLNLSNLDTSKVTNMGGMFVYCTSLKSLDLSCFDTSRVTDMNGMFNSCSSLKSLDLSGFDASRVKNMGAMFANCSSLKSIYASGPMNIKKAANSTSMFFGCTSLVGGNGTKYDASHIDAKYARIDKKGKPGYFTSKKA